MTCACVSVTGVNASDAMRDRATRIVVSIIRLKKSSEPVIVCISLVVYVLVRDTLVTLSLYGEC